MPSVERSISPQAHVPLAPLTTLGIGGHARWFVRATTAEDVAAAHRMCAEMSLPLFILGGGSNLVVADEGIDGLVLQIALPGIETVTEGETTTIRAGAGEPWDDVVEASVSRGLAGIECLSGIPGSVGGTPIQNVGAYGQEVSAVIADVTVFDRTSEQMTVIDAADCGFGYRMSRFKGEDAGRFVVCEVRFELRPGPPTLTYPDVITHLERAAISSPTLEDVRHAVLSIRRAKGMVMNASDSDTCSVGSFFVNPVVSAEVHARLISSCAEPVPAFAMPDGRVKIPAAWLIERAGFSRGHQSGRVSISSKHPLAIVNRGGATAGEVLALATLIKRQVADRFGIWLRPEPVFAGFNDEPEIAYLRRANN